MKVHFQSIRWRLQAWHGLLLLLVVGGFGAPAFRLAMDNQMQRIDRELGRTERGLIRSLMVQLSETPPNAADPPPMAFGDFVQRLRTTPLTLPADKMALFQGREPGYAYFSLRDREGRIILQSANAPTDLVLLPVPGSDIVEDAQTTGNRREVRRSSSHGLQTVVGRDITPDLEEIHRFAWSLAASAGGVWLFGLAGGWWLSRNAIRPIEAISHTASRIAEGNLEERIDTTDMDTELGKLSSVLNQTFDRLHAAFERQRQFTADASHELRTPVTIMLSETQRILKRERTPEEYREALQTCGATAQRMRYLIESLLLLARQETQDLQAHHIACDLAMILSETTEHLGTLATAKDIRVVSHLAPTLCQGDPSSLAILVTNLITNAIEHQPQGGQIELTSGVIDGQAFFTVRDGGPGISAADLPHIFERFYRADQARVSAGGHLGLGLAIAKAIVVNHGGQIRVTSEPARGACFEVTLPAAKG